MTGCDEAAYAVVLTVEHTYVVTARGEEEATKEALKLMGEGLKAKVVWPIRNEVTALEPSPTVAHLTGHRAQGE